MTPFKHRLDTLHSEFPTISNCKLHVYDVCHFPKQKKLQLLVSVTYASYVFDLIHVDIWGLILPPLFKAIIIFSLLLMISCFSWLFFMKAEVKPQLQYFVKFVAIQFNTIVKIMRSDNRLEFLMKDFIVCVVKYTKLHEMKPHNRKEWLSANIKTSKLLLTPISIHYATSLLII